MAQRTCSIEGCDCPHYGKGMCEGCYNAARRATPEYKAAHRAYQATYSLRPEGKAVRKARDAAYWATPEGNAAERAKGLLSKYGITVADYDAILIAQGGGCAGCGVATSRDGRRLAVDHDHKCCPGSRSCGKCVRGLLCTNCNRGLGRLADDPARLSRLIDYLNRTSR